MLKIFINEFGRLRSGWRVLIFALASLAVWYILAAVLSAAYAVVFAVAPSLRVSSFIPNFIYRAAIVISALAAGYLCARFLEGLPWRSLGLTFHTGWLRDLIIGAVVGFGALVVAVAIAMTGGGLNFSLNRLSLASTGRSLLSSAILLCVAALAEEAMFRGYPLQTLTRAKLAWLGVLITSFYFGLAHLLNPNVVVGITFVNTALAGFWLAVAYLRTRSLWLPWGVHWAWNWALGSFFGLPISGLKLVSHPLLNANDQGPAWLTGGDYGIEGGVACTVAMTLFTLFLWRTRWITATPDLMKLTSEENPAVPAPVLSIRSSENEA